MAQTVSIVIGAEDRARLATILDDRNAPQKHVQRARIVLLCAERLTALEVSRRSGTVVSDPLPTVTLMPIGTVIERANSLIVYAERGQQIKCISLAFGARRCDVIPKPQ